MHESQSRLWENVVGRGRSFWQYFYPFLQRAFPDQLSKVPFEAFYRAINRVERSLIRTDADEVTYNLHIMLRFELELELLEGRLRAKDLSEAWRAGMQDYLGIVPARRSRWLPAGRPLVCRQHRWWISELHYRQHSQRAVLRCRCQSTSRISRVRSQSANSVRCMLGCANISINMDASLSRTNLSSGRLVGR